MKSLFCFCFFLFVQAAELPDRQLLLREALRYELTEQVVAQEGTLTERCPAPDAPQVRDALAAWQQREITRLRNNLHTRFGEKARETFGAFMETFAAAEAAKEESFLLSLELSEVPVDFAGLRRQIVETGLADTMADASQLLSEIQTWATLRSQRDDVPTLSVWLERDPPPAAPTPTPRPSNPLRDAESVGEWTPPTAPTGTMDSFAERRQKRRDQALADAHAGMEQVAGEREAAERDAAARKLAAAQADAEAMRAQAQRLAATEEEALAQRENSWGNRLKRIVGSTLGAATGALTGGIGAEAGRRAANEIFD